MGSPFVKMSIHRSLLHLVTQGNYQNGTFTSTSGLSLDLLTGDITPNTSTPGTYTVTYNIPASAPYPASTTTTQVTITELPTASHKLRFRQLLYW